VAKGTAIKVEAMILWAYRKVKEFEDFLVTGRALTMPAGFLWDTRDVPVCPTLKVNGYSRRGGLPRPPSLTSNFSHLTSHSTAGIVGNWSKK